MSNLYVRIKTGFYTHRKTARLQAAIGTDAFWIPPRLWAYAADQQPDGNFSDYSSEQLAMLLGCHKYATSIKQALLEAGFLDADGMIHDWHDHAGYHSRYAERAKIASAERWREHNLKKKEKNQKKEEVHKTVDSGEKHCFTDACSINPAFPSVLQTPEFQAVWKEWEAHRREIRKALTPTSVRRQLQNLAEKGIDRAIVTIRHSIASGWQGLFEPEGNRTDSNGHHRAAAIPIWKQIEIIAEEIEVHPANPQFRGFNSSTVTQDQREHLKLKRDKLAELKASQSKLIR